MLTRRKTITAILIITMLTAFAAVPVPALAAYSISFSNAYIQVTSPGVSGLSYDGVVMVEGTSILTKVWLCVRGPGGELITYPANVKDGRFKVNIYLRFGPGTYTVWAGDNANRFDGSIRFELINTQQDNNRYLAPSAYVDSDNPEIIATARAITKNAKTNWEKARAIHDWVARNISYDYDLYLNGENRLVPASQTLKTKTGICRDYAFLVAALARAAGIPARVVYGEASGGAGWEPQAHAWNELLIDGQWVSVDTTWDAGYIRNARFVGSYTTKYFAPSQTVFAKTHRNATYTVH